MKIALIYFENNHNSNLIDLVMAENNIEKGVEIFRINGYFDTGKELITIKTAINYKDFDYIIRLNDSAYIKDYSFLTNIDKNFIHFSGNSYILTPAFYNSDNTRLILKSQLTKSNCFPIKQLKTNIVDLQITDAYTKDDKTPYIPKPEWLHIKNNIPNTGKSIGIFYIGLGVYSKLWPRIL